MLPIILSFVVAAAFTWLFASRFTPLKILDHPNERSLHAVPVHRTGGLGLLAGIFAGAVIAFYSGAIGMPVDAYIISIAVLLGISFLDDLKDVSIKIRMLVQLLVAFTISRYLLNDQWMLLIPVAVGLVWMINLYNFMDGMDGFAGGMAAWGFGFMSLIAHLQGASEAALYCSLIAAAAAGFLLLNFPPAKIFMGDAGSTLIGFFAGIAIVYFHVENILFAGLGVLLFSPFIIDATVTLLRRMLRRERFWQAHRTHYYQRLVRAGWGHRSTVLAEYGLMLACGLTVISIMHKPALHWPVIVIWLVVYAALMIGLEKTVLQKA